MKVAIYLRVSTQVQDYERQRHEIEDYCGRNGHEIVKIYEEKMSGANDERVEFNKVRLLTKETIDAVVVWEFSRLGRKISTVINTIEDFTNKGISLIALKENFQSLDENGKMTSSATIMMSLYSTMAMIERQNIIERTMSGKLDRLNNGEIDYTDSAPFGYSYENKRLIINEQEAEIVRKIYTEYKNGLSQPELARLYGKHQSQIHRILSNPVYCGRPYSKLIGKTLSSPSIITPELFEEVKNIRETRYTSREKKGSHQHPLRGKIYCEFCGHLLSYKGEAWGCHCMKSSIQEKFINKTLDMVMAEYSKKMDFERTQKLDIDVDELTKQYEGVSKLMYAHVDKLKELHEKYDLLKTAFGEEKLKKEKKEIKKNEQKLIDYDSELWDIRKKLADAKNKIQITKDNSSEIIHRVTLHIIDRAHKSLIFELIGGEKYTVTIRMRKNEYTLSHGD